MVLAKPWQHNDVAASGRQMLNKVPEITVYFWLIKVLCTTVGETAADFLNANLNLGLTGTTLVMGTLLLITLAFQFRGKSYVPSIYWLAVVFLSVVGTLITDNLTDHFGLSLTAATILFGLALAATFGAWDASERTLSVHTIRTARREAFYWLAILFTFALGTAAGDLVAEKVDLGYARSALLFGAIIAAVAVAHFRFKLNEVLAFWLAYIVTRPLGASLGDYLTQPRDSGGLGLGTVATSILFLSAIAITVTYLAVTKKDVVVAVAVPNRGSQQRALSAAMPNDLLSTTVRQKPQATSRAARQPEPLVRAQGKQQAHLPVSRRTRPRRVGLRP